MPRWQPQLWYRLNSKVLLIELGDVASLRLLRLNGRSRLSISSSYPDDDTAPSRLFDGRDAQEAIATAQSVVAFAGS